MSQKTRGGRQKQSSCQLRVSKCRRRGDGPPHRPWPLCDNVAGAIVALKRGGWSIGIAALAGMDSRQLQRTD